MARFPFAKSHKKALPQLVVTEPMSKAHKILGSTPINIDSSKPLDDDSSAFSGETGDSTVLSYLSTEDDSSDHVVAIAESEDGWATEPEILPAIIEPSNTDTDRGFSDMNGAVRKTKSSSTIRSWYETPKQQLEQTSASSMTNSMPSKIHKMLDLESVATSRRMKRKPPMLDFTALRSVSRLSRKLSHSPLKSDGVFANDPEGASKSPSIMSLISPAGKWKIQKRHTKDGMLSPPLGTPRPHTAASKRPGSSTKEIPSLYDHYEQMTLRQLMQEEAQEENENQESKSTEEVEDDDQKELGGDQDQHWFHDPLPATPQTSYMTGLTPAAARDRSNSATGKPTANSRRLKKTDRPLGHPDLQETSMLMLSDSEDDERPGLLQPSSQTSSPIRIMPHSSASPRKVSRLQSSTMAPLQVSDLSPTRNSKRTNSATTNTYISIPNSRRHSTDNAISISIDSRSSTPFSEIPSYRSSLLSAGSSASTLQSRADYIQEARAVTMASSLRPCRIDCGEKNSPESEPSPICLPSMSRRYPSITQTPQEQLTPPLSPSSVDFYIRSARSSIDGPLSQNRFMTVTRQEEMLLSALRHKKRHSSHQSIDMPEEQPLQSRPDVPNETQKKDNRIQELEAAAAALIDFGFPAPPTAWKQPLAGSVMTASTSASSFASTVATDKIAQESIDEGCDSILDSRQSSLNPASSTQAPPTDMDQREGAEQPDASLYSDDDEPSPDMIDVSEFEYLALPSLLSGRDETFLRSGSPVSDPTSPQASSPSSRSASELKRIDRGHRLEQEEEEDIPRPDSPISPDAFPAVPQIRTTLSSKARLSAVGPALMAGEPGWWGDDD